MKKLLLTLALIFPSSLATAEETITIATFNIQILGKSKTGKPDIMKKLAEIIRKYDVVAVQEIKDVKNKAAFTFLEYINNGQTTKYKMALSERTGQQADDKNSKEQYAYYYNPKKIRLVGRALLFDDNEKDHFQREPFVAQFVTKAGNFSFVLIAIHTRPQSALKEVVALHDVVEWAKKGFLNEDDFIVLGDFNASCTYVSPDDLEGKEIKGSEYIWIVPDDADTNLASRDCAYDRIVITQGAKDDYAGVWGIDKAFTDNKISDHWPVWAKFHVDEDGEDEVE